VLFAIVVLFVGVQARPGGQEPRSIPGSAPLGGLDAPKGPTPGGDEWPCRLGLPRPIVPRIAKLWAASPTFRRQCARLADAHVTVTLVFSPRLPSGLRGASKILRKNGRVFFMSTMLRDEVHLEEDFPHELEHAIEQIEGRDLEADAAAGRGAWAANVHGYETERARAAARRVLEELQEAQRHFGKRAGQFMVTVIGAPRGSIAVGTRNR
jgi:hypothetical protein